MSPLFHTAALQSYSPTMNEAVDRVLAQLDAAAGGPPVDLHGLLGQMTMQVGLLGRWGLAGGLCYSWLASRACLGPPTSCSRAVPLACWLALPAR